MSTEPSSKPVFPITDEVRHALAVTKRGVDELLVEEEFAQKLARSATGTPLRIKLGLDPTAPDIHIGHTVVLNKMRQLQDLGHTVIFLIGDFTSLIGDPSGRNATRPPLTREQIESNAKTYFEQAALVLDRDKTEIRYNSEWSMPLGADGMIKLASRYTVARILEREDFTKRFQGGVPISIHEFLYPLMRGYDSVALNADLGRRHRPEIQPAGRPRTAEAVWPGTAVHSHDAAARRPRRRREDVEVEGQLRRHQRAAERHVRQADEHLGHADVALLRAAVVPSDGRDRRLQARDRRRPQPARLQGAARAGNRRALPLAGRRRACARGLQPPREGRCADDIPSVTLAGAPLAIGQC